jgi:hypothetical protein
MDARSDDFELLRPNLLHYMSTIMPHMLPVLDASVDKTENELALRSPPAFKSIPKEMFSKALRNIRTDLETFTVLVNYLQKAPIQEQYCHHEAIIQAMVVSLDQGFLI